MGWIQAIFNDSDALPLPKRKDGGYQIDVPESGVPRTSYPHVNDASARDEFYYRVQLPGGRTELQRVPETYVLPGPTHGGYTMMDADGKGGGLLDISLLGLQDYGQKFLTRTGKRLQKNTPRLTGAFGHSAP